MPKNWKDWSILITCLLIAHAAGALGSVFTITAIPLWYSALVLPPFSPPNWVFGPVWTLLYTLLGIALYIVWRTRGGDIERGRRRTRAVTLFAVQLILNALWSILFFGLQSPLYALVDIALLVVFISATMVYFFKVNKIAGYLLIPYLLWVIFAGVLNYSIFVLN